MPAPARRAFIKGDLIRCAIYTRKSTSLGLEGEVNSLQYQREVCQAHVKCQAHRNWVELPQGYDDGGYSGGTLERPGLKRLLADVEAGRIDMVVIYKIDRLSRSLTDFVRLIDLLDKYEAGFVSVTQTFDTSDSMGRLVLNILLTFAQFEREIMSDRVRDKKAALLRRGYFVGGTPPSGYLRGSGGKLVIDPAWIGYVQEIFARFPTESAAAIARDFQQRGVLTRQFRTKAGKVRGGQKVWCNSILGIIRNPIYAGYFRHRDELVEAKVEPVVTLEQWQQAQEILTTRFPQERNPVHNFLLGILHDEHGRRMKIQRGTGRSRNGRCYRSEYAGWARKTIYRTVLVGADRVEELAISSLKAFLCDRVKLRQSILALGRYSDETERLIKRGEFAASRIDKMDRTQLRELFLALVPRAEVTRFDLRLLVSCHELEQFLSWDGKGIFRKCLIKPSRGVDQFRMIYAPAFLICGHPYYALPIQPFAGEPHPDRVLVNLLETAADLRDFMLANRNKSIQELARDMQMGPNYFARMLRVNYLAPDIQAAIFDGTQPEGLTPSRIVFSSLPLDWEQQRRLLGFC